MPGPKKFSGKNPPRKRRTGLVVRTAPPVAGEGAALGRNIHWLVGLAYLIYVLFFLRYPLTHPHEIQVGHDISTSYDSKFFWIESLRSGDIGFWNPYAHLGVPFLANPVMGPFSITNLFRFLFSTTYSFVWEAAAHFWLAAFGAYLFMISLGCRWLSAAVTGFVFAFGAALVLNNWDTQLPLWYSGAWIPAVFYCLNEAIKTSRARWVVATAACLALALFDGFPQMVQYIFMLSGFYLVGAWLGKKITLGRLVGIMAALVALFLVLGACQILPSMEYFRQTGRWNWGLGYVLNEIVRPVDLMTYLNPYFLGSPVDNSFHGRWSFQTEVLYIGWIPLALFTVGIFIFKKVPGFLWMLLMALLFTELAMADSTPLSNALFMFFYHYVPMFAHFRNPNRMMFLVQFAMACGAGLVLDYWIKCWQARQPKKGPIPWFIYAVALLAVADLIRFDWPFVRTADESYIIGRDQIFPDPMMQWALDDKDYCRVEPPNRLTQNMYWHLFQPVNLDPTYLAGVDDYMGRWESNPDSPLSDLIGLKYAYVFMGGITPASTRFHSLSPQYPYFWINNKSMPRAFLVGGYQVSDESASRFADDLGAGRFDYRNLALLEKKPEGLPASAPGTAGDVQITRYGNDEILLRGHAKKPGLLLVSDSYFPGWKAFLNGRPTEILRADTLFRAVAIPQAGDFEVQMKYWPTHLTAGLMISAAGWLGLAVCGILIFWRKQRDLAGGI
jgi:hypothetical protein